MLKCFCKAFASKKAKWETVASKKTDFTLRTGGRREKFEHKKQVA